MYKLPEFVRWADEDIIKSVKERILSKYSISDINEEIDLSKISFKELRDWATFVAEIGYDASLYENLGYDIRVALVSKLNHEFNVRIGEIVEIYDVLDSSLNREKWGGEERYKLLVLTNRKGYSEMGCLKNAVWFMHLKGKPVDIHIAKELGYLMNHTLYWEFGNEIRNIDFEKNKESFNICNAGRIKEIEAQNKFIDLIFNKNISEAYEMIESLVGRIFDYRSG